MKIQFINHSSINISLNSGMRIVCDPWIYSKVFNNSWRLKREHEVSINGHGEAIVFISHEHPDHFNIPTLKKYFQNSHAIIRNDFREEIANALTRMNIKAIRMEPNKLHTLPSGDEICLISYYGDTGIYIRDGKSGHRIFNFNDCEYSPNHVKGLKGLIGGSVDVVAGQFGLAGYYGNSDEKEPFNQAARIKLDRLVEVSNALENKYILPFASYAEFCKRHNKHINERQVKLEDVRKIMYKNLKKAWIPYIGEEIDLNNLESTLWPKMSDKRVEYWDDFKNNEELVEDVNMAIEDVYVSFKNFINKLRYTGAVVGKGKIYKLGIKCKEQTYYREIELDKHERREIDKLDVDFVVPSDELDFAFKYAWGADTLNITGSAYVLNLEKYREFCGIINYIWKTLLSKK